MGGRGYGSRIHDILSGQHADLHFPVSFDTLVKAQLDYHAFNLGDTLQFGDFRIETVQLNHAGITIGYRIEADGGVATIYTDIGRIRETRLGDGMGMPVPNKIYAEAFLAQLAHCARHSDILAHDTQFFEYVVLFHHTPDHDDKVLDQMGLEAADLAAGTSVQVLMARDGLVLDAGTGE